MSVSISDSVLSKGGKAEAPPGKGNPRELCTAECLPQGAGLCSAASVHPGQNNALGPYWVNNSGQLLWGTLELGKLVATRLEGTKPGGTVLVGSSRSLR